MNPPTKEDVERFWKPLYENKKEYNTDTVWLEECKSPGLGKLCHFWWNKLTTLHPKGAIASEKLIVQPENCPDKLTTGQITLIARKEPLRNPSNYRPITCLSIMSKILSSIVTSRMSHHNQYHTESKSYGASKREIRAIVMAQSTSLLTTK